MWKTLYIFCACFHIYFNLSLFIFSEKQKDWLFVLIKKLVTLHFKINGERRGTQLKKKMCWLRNNCLFTKLTRMVECFFLLSVSCMCGINTLACALVVLTEARITTWMKTCSLRMPWIPFGKFILPLCQLSLIYVKAVRQHHWFRRLTLIQFMERESSCFSQITEAYRRVPRGSRF